MSDNMRIEQLLTIIAQEVFLARKDKEEHDAGPLSDWNEKRRSKILEIIDDLRLNLKLH